METIPQAISDNNHQGHCYCGTTCYAVFSIMDRTLIVIWRIQTPTFGNHWQYSLLSITIARGCPEYFPSIDICSAYPCTHT